MDNEYIELSLLELNEGYPVRYYSQYIPDENEKKYHKFCHHLQENGFLRLIQGLNEGGYNSTFMCWDCLLEQLGK